MLEALGKKAGFTLDTPFNDIPAEIVKMILYGSNEKLEVLFKSERTGSEYKHVGTFEGVIPQLQRYLQSTESESHRESIMKFMVEKSCPACEGKRLKPVVLAVRIGEMNIAEMTASSVEKLISIVNHLPLSANEQEIANYYQRN